MTSNFTIDTIIDKSTWQVTWQVILQLILQWFTGPQKYPHGTRESYQDKVAQNRDKLVQNPGNLQTNILRL